MVDGGLEGTVAAPFLLMDRDFPIDWLSLHCYVG